MLAVICFQTLNHWYWSASNNSCIWQHFFQRVSQSNIPCSIKCARVEIHFLQGGEEQERGRTVIYCSSSCTSKREKQKRFSQIVILFYLSRPTTLPFSSKVGGGVLRFWGRRGRGDLNNRQRCVRRTRGWESSCKLFKIGPNILSMSRRQFLLNHLWDEDLQSVITML